MKKTEKYDFLDRILVDRVLHAKFLNTLSFLEYIGARKIFKGRDEKSVDHEALMHMSEEIRHALLFKRFAMKVCSQERGYNHEGVFCYEITRRYIGRLDEYCEKLVERDDCYTLVSYIIELRALSFYRHYARKLEKFGVGFSLKSLLAEEERHLVEMEEKIKCNISSDIVREASDFEGHLFDELADGITEEIQESARSSSTSRRSGEISISKISMSSYSSAAPSPR